MSRRPRASRRRRKPLRKRTAAKPARKPRNPHPLDDFIAAGARALDLKVHKTWLPAVRDHLEVTLRHGALVAAFDLPDDSEPAPVFKA